MHIYKPSNGYSVIDLSPLEWYSGSPGQEEGECWLGGVGGVASERMGPGGELVSHFSWQHELSEVKPDFSEPLTSGAIVDVWGRSEDASFSSGSSEQPKIQPSTYFIHVFAHYTNTSGVPTR